MADTQSQPEQTAPRMQLDMITLENLNAHIANGNELLQRLKHQTLAASKQNDSQWEQRFSAAEGTPIFPDTTVGVIGSTGSGKSSILNALLDEEVLVPTSCMQACTATNIEVLWNPSSEHAYIAEVCFVDAEAWRPDITAALKDAVTSPAYLNDDTTEAGMAFKRITAVYPWVNKQNIKQITVDELMEAQHTQQLLSTTIELNASDAKQMHDYLKKYVEGKEKLQISFSDHGHTVSSMVDTIEYWPMVSKVRIYLKSYILQTGIVIADLPGVGDSNTARGTISQRHLSKCANIWIVTPIGRAVDDKVARNLLGDSFKRQLRRDGVMSRVAFVCSKADELVVNELRERLRLSSDFMKSIETINQNRSETQRSHQQTEEQLRNTEDSIKSMTARIKGIGSQKTAYIRLKKLAKEGQVVHPVAARRSKRTAAKKANSPRKQPKILDYMFSQPSSIPANPDIDIEDADGMDSDGDCKDVENVEDTVEQDLTLPAITISDIDATLKALRDEENTLGDSKRALREKVQEYRLDLETYASRLQKLVDKEWSTYFEGRNTYCRRTIRADFANGIRDLEDKEAQLDDDEYDPEAAAAQAEQLQLQEDLPVFCVSSQGFQKLRGRLQGEKITSKFTNHQQTGIPELLMHCYGLGQDNLKSHFQKYTENATNLLTSVRFWLTGPSDTATAAVPYTMQDATDDMLGDISMLVKTALTDVNNMVLGRLIKIFEGGAKAAQDKALDVVEEWTDLNANGLRYQTYRAVIRRGGAFARQNRNLDFADDLLEPLLTCIDGVWNNVFNERIPRRLHDLRRDIRRTIWAYAEGLDQHAEFLAVSSKTAQMYRQQVQRFKADLTRSVDEIAVLIKSAQQETNRLFAGNIRKELEAICTVLDNDSGKGVFARMKAGMHDSIAGIRDSIFDDSVKAVEGKLVADLEDLTSKFVDNVETTCKKSRTDCRRLFAKKTHGGGATSPQHKAAIQEILEQAERFFEPQLVAAIDADSKAAEGSTSSQRELSLPVRSSVTRALNDQDEQQIVQKEANDAGVKNDGSSLVLSGDNSDGKNLLQPKKEILDGSP